MNLICLPRINCCTEGVETRLARLHEAVLYNLFVPRGGNELPDIHWQHNWSPDNDVAVLNHAIWLAG